MWVEAVPTEGTLENASGNQGVCVSECVVEYGLLLHSAVAHRAVELPVESLELLLLGGEYVLVALDRFAADLRVHFDEGSHTKRVN